MSSVTLRNVSKHFGETGALSCIDLQIEDGEFCVLLGPSGCGKSTLLNIIAGLVSQDSGSVLMDGGPVDSLSPRERDVAMVFQNYALYPHMTVAENLGFGLRMRKTAKSEIGKRIEETSRLLGIEGLLTRKPRELSGGQQQRVAMGRALVRRPRLFLLDEPLSNLDARLRADVRLELRQLHRQIQGTILYVTHDQVEAMSLGDKVVVMQAGEIHQIGSPTEIYDRPVDRFVATFIGSPEMNLYHGKVTRRSDGLVFSGDGFALGIDETRQGLENGNVELGFRPEDILVGDKGGPVLSVEAEMLTDVGSEKYIHGRIGRERITIRAGKGEQLERGKALIVSVDSSRIHLFQNGRRI